MPQNKEVYPIHFLSALFTIISSFLQKEQPGCHNIITWKHVYGLPNGQLQYITGTSSPGSR